MPTCFSSSGRTPTLCIGSDASCPAAPGATDRNAAATASDASNTFRTPNLPDATTLTSRLLAHFVILIPLQHESARSHLILIGNVRDKRRWVADACGNVSCSARGQSLLQRQIHCAIHRDAHYAVVLVHPSIAIQKFCLLFAIAMQFCARFHLQTRCGRQYARILKR